MRASGTGPDLWSAVKRRSARAAQSGALQRIETRIRFIEDEGIRFVVRAVSSLAAKNRQRIGDAEASGANPFLPYDEALFVAEVSDTHVCLLNKFNVIDHHVLIVTRVFEDQEELLTAADFAALWTCLAEIDGLGFYNGGPTAGASQRHKHLQIVPLPLAGEGPRLPIEPLLAKAPGGQRIAEVPGLPFVHAFCRLPSAVPAASGTPPARLHALYRALLAEVDVGEVEMDGASRQSAPYNLLVTREWMLVVPRSRECSEGISVNALGFAGSLFVRNDGEMRVIEAVGPMTVLRRVARPDGSRGSA